MLWWAKHKLGVPEVRIRTVHAMYNNTSASVRVGTSLSDPFLVLSLLLFIMMLEALSIGYGTVSPWELRYADDLALVADSMKELTISSKNGKRAWRAKGKVNVGKTKVMVSIRRSAPVRKKGKHPCAICHNGVDKNYVQCTSCGLWVN